MNFRFLFRKFCICLSLLALAVSAFGQRLGSTVPRQETLLNGLKLLMWNTPGSDKATVKIRIHSGSAFDPQGKEGLMKMLAENLFPTEAAREFFRDDLGGSLDISSNFDYIQIDASGRSSELLTMLETLASAVSNPTIDKETTASLKASQTVKIKELEADPAYVADQAVAKRLFGTFPYGRPEHGTLESVGKIDFADLIEARQRFISADNATIAVSGSIDPNLTYRAVRRYFGSWLKSDKKAPSTFRQPDPPQSGMPVFDSPVPNKSEFRFAVRGFARSDKDFHASAILAIILRSRTQLREGNSAFVRGGWHILPGSFVFGVADWNLGRIEKRGDKISLPVMDGYQKAFLDAAIKPDEFESAKREFVSTMSAADVAQAWLDADTFKLGKPEPDIARNITIADVQRVLERLQKEPVAYALVFASEKASEASQTSNR